MVLDKPSSSSRSNAVNSLSAAAANDLSTGQLMDSSTFVFSFQLLKACIHLHQCIRLAHAWLTNCNASFQRDKLLEDKPSSSSIPMKLSYTSLIHEHPFWYNLISQHTRVCGLLTGFTRGRRHLFKILPQEQMRYEVSSNSGDLRQVRAAMRSIF